MRVVRVVPSLLIVGFLLACQADAPTSSFPGDPTAAFSHAESSASADHRAMLGEVAQFMAQNNMGNGAVFIDPSFPNFSVGLIKDVSFDPVNGFRFRGATFEGAYGKGDFWRLNPDGTATVHLATNQATASYTDAYSGEYYAGSGSFMQSFTGELVQFGPFPPRIFGDPSERAAVVRGNGTVTLNGDPQGVRRKLKMESLQTPGGQNKFNIVLGN